MLGSFILGFRVWVFGGSGFCYSAPKPNFFHVIGPEDLQAEICTVQTRQENNVDRDGVPCNRHDAAHGSCVLRPASGRLLAMILSSY